MTNPLLARFIPEARDLIQASATGLLRLEKTPGDAAVVNEVFRAVHTLKGSSGLFEVMALTKLVHAAEDLLGAVRTDEMELSSELVDRLLDSLDRAGEWIDYLERHETLPKEADGISRDMVLELRAFGHPQEAPTAPETRTASAAGQPADWLAEFTEAERMDAFRQLAGGTSLVAVRYRPDETCFYNGTDPLNLVLQLDDVLGFSCVPREPFAAPADIDPYRCNLDFQVMTASSPTEVEQLFRYDLDQIDVHILDQNDLVRLFGDSDGSPVWADFFEGAQGQIATADAAGLLSAGQVLIDLMGDGLAPVSALRWLATLLETGTPVGAPLVRALVEAVASGHLVLPAAAPEPEVAEATLAPAPPPSAERKLAIAIDPLVLPADTEGRVAQGLLQSQRRALLLGRTAPAAFQAIATTIGNLALRLGRADVQAVADAAGLLARETGTGAPLLELLDGLDPANATASSDPVVVAAPPAAAAARPDAGSPAAEPASAAPAKMLKVDQAKIDLLMNLIGELVVSKNSLPFLSRKAEEVYGSRDMARELKEQYVVIDRLAQEMQSAIMQVRMLPVSDVFARFPRLVRDISRKLGKRIALSIEGGETAADKTIIEALGDPLLHIVRNSLDHGIESAAERTASGKSAEARIGLLAYQEADSVVIEISDDGKGIDPVRIRDAAVAKGVISQEAAERLSDQEAINLIYKPGFSTAAEVSDLSGRGVGMDVVLTTVEKLGGTVQVTSRLGEGTLTRVSLPLSMAVTRVMMVEAAGSLYGIPMELIVETVRVPLDAIRTIKRAETFILRDAVIPLVRMHTLLGLRDEGAARPVPAEEAVLVCRVNGAPVGLIIDSFREGMDVILKPLEGLLSKIRGYSGTTLLGDGRVLLILDLKELL